MPVAPAGPPFASIVRREPREGGIVASNPAHGIAWDQGSITGKAGKSFSIASVSFDCGLRAM